MRIEAGYRPSPTARAASRPGAAVAFETAGSQAAARSSAPSASAAAANIGALLALQLVADPLLARRRAMRRGRAILDQLDRLQAEVIVGLADTSGLDRMAAFIAEERDRIEPGIDAVLDEIEVRARVELAKRGRF